MRIVTWNVNGVRAREREVLELVATARPDVVALQEIKSSPEDLPPGLGGLLGLPDYASRWHGRGGYSGVSLHLRKATFGAAPVFSHPAFDRDARVVVAACGGATFASVYVPNGGKDYADKLRFLRELAEWTGTLRGAEAAVCGDLNVTRGDADVHESERDARAIGQRADERALFERMLAAGLVDVGRALAPEGARLYTWWPYWSGARASGVGWRIDYVAATPPFAAKARRVEVLRGFGTSDHAPLVVDFA